MNECLIHCACQFLAKCPPNNIDLLNLTYLELVITKFKNICVLPEVRIPEREERRLPRQCNSQKGKFITDWSQGFLPQPKQWRRVRKSLEQRLLPKFIRHA